jgi:hypothetical protein
VERKKNLLRPCFEVPSFVLGALGMVKCKKICSWLPTFDVKNRRLYVKKNCCNFFHGDLGMVETIFFALYLLLSTLKVRSREQKNCLGHALSFKLRV